MRTEPDPHQSILPPTPNSELSGMFVDTRGQISLLAEQVLLPHQWVHQSIFSDV